MKALRSSMLALWCLMVTESSLALMDRPWWVQPLEYDLADVPDLDVPQTDILPNRIDRSRTVVAKYLNNMSAGLDGFMVDVFFGEEVLQDEVGGSRIKLRYDQRYQDGRDAIYNTQISVNTHFPHISERMRLLIESDEDENSDEGTSPRISDNLERQRYSAALRVLLRSTDRWKTDVDVGVRWQFPPDPFTQFRARRFDQFGYWRLRTTQTVYYRVSDGAGEKTSLQWDYPLNTEAVVRLTQQAEYQLVNAYFELGYSAGLYQKLSGNRAMSYQLSASGDSQDRASFYRYRAAIQYRQQVYRSWLFFDVIPEVLWQRDLQYRTTPAITFRLEALIAQ